MGKRGKKQGSNLSQKSKKSEDTIQKIFSSADDQQHKRLEQLLAQVDSPEAAVNLLKAEHRSGPLPSPKELKEYEEEFPGLAEKIVSMRESVVESGCRYRDAEARVIEKDAATREDWVNNNYKLGLCGIIISLIIASAVLGVVTFLGYYNKIEAIKYFVGAGGGLGCFGLICWILSFFLKPKENKR